MRLENTYLLFKRKNLLFWLALPFLYILSFIYFVTVVILRFLYKVHILPSYRPKAKVISIGNITLGGTGKTPLVQLVVDYLNKKKKKAGIVIRGYKRPKGKKKRSIDISETSYFQYGDEASMLKGNLCDGINVCVGRDKIKSAKELENQGCDVCVLDDGFQHWRLKRDLDIVTVDSTFPIFGQKLLPLGRLREPLRCLMRADIFVLTKTDFLPSSIKKRKQEIRKINPKALIVSSIYKPLCFFDMHKGSCIEANSKDLKNKPVFILVGIANPLYFDKLLSILGLKIVRELVYPDHYEYSEDDISKIKELAKNLEVDTIITTQKDAERLKHLLNKIKPLHIMCLKIQVEITENEEEFYSRILSVCNS